jgi:hypothetical protein
MQRITSYINNPYKRITTTIQDGVVDIPITSLLVEENKKYKKENFNDVIPKERYKDILKDKNNEFHYLKSISDSKPSANEALRVFYETFANVAHILNRVPMNEYIIERRIRILLEGIKSTSKPVWEGFLDSLQMSPGFRSITKKTTVQDILDIRNQPKFSISKLELFAAVEYLRVNILLVGDPKKDDHLVSYKGYLAIPVTYKEEREICPWIILQVITYEKDIVTIQPIYMNKSKLLLNKDDFEKTMEAYLETIESSAK